MLPKLNTELHTKTIGVEGKNGLEVNRLICNTVDAVPENYQFYLDFQLTAMPQIYGDKIKGLKKLYGFRMMLKAKVVVYKQAIGLELDHGQLKQTLRMPAVSGIILRHIATHAIGNRAAAAHADRQDGNDGREASCQRAWQWLVESVARQAVIVSTAKHMVGSGELQS